MPDIKNVLVLLELTNDRRKELESICGANYVYSNYHEVSEEMVQKADIIFGSVPKKLLKNAVNLRWLQLNTAGSDFYQEPGIFPKQAVLTNATGSYGLAIAEHMIGALLVIIKKYNLYLDNQKNRIWRDEGKIASIDGSTTLIIGLGDIGTEFSKRMRALGSYTIGVKRTKPDVFHDADELHLPDQIDALLPRADIVALALPKTEETNKILSLERIHLLKENAVVINVGRGSAVDTDALCDALEAGKIGGAALDVTDPEPLPENHRLWHTPNTFITPHISGGYNLNETYEKVLDISFNNFRAFVSGGKLKNIVDFNVGY